MVSMWTLYTVLIHVGLVFSWHYEHLKPDDVEAVVRREQGAEEVPRDLSELTSQVNGLARMLAETRAELDATKRNMREEIDRLSSTNVPQMELECSTRFTHWYDTVGKTLEYLDQFGVSCHHNEFLRQWRMTWGARGTRKSVRFVCCRFSKPEHSHRRHHHHHREQTLGAGDSSDSQGRNMRAWHALSNHNDNDDNTRGGHTPKPHTASPEQVDAR